MPQVKVQQPRPERRRRPLTDNERAEVLARIVEIIFSDPGASADQYMSRQSDNNPGGSLPPPAAATPLAARL